MEPQNFCVVNLGCKVNRVEADALSAALMLFVLGPMLAYMFTRRKSQKAGGRFGI